MKIAFAIEAGDDLGALVSVNFGRAPRFLIVDTDSANATVTFDNPHSNDERGAGPGTVGTLIGHGCNSAVAGQFGPKALSALEAAGMTPYTALKGATVNETLNAVVAGNLKPYNIQRF